MEPLGSIVAQQMFAAAATLRDREIEVSVRIHETRKRIKETRAVLRLFRDAIGPEQFTIENRWYRDAARELADYRDADAAVAALASLSPAVKEELGTSILRRLRALARSEHRTVYRDRERAEAVVENLAAQLPIAAARLGNAAMDIHLTFGSIKPGLVKTLRDGKRAMREAYESRNAIAFHEWRKRVKDHWYQIQHVENVWPEELTPRKDLLNELAHLLGEHHDLEVIRGIVTAAEEKFTVEESAKIEAALTRRQSRLARKSKSLGARIYGTRPADFARRLAKRWK